MAADPPTPVVGRPRSFTDAELIAAGLELGPEALSLSGVAALLSVPRSTVYNRVATPQELGALILRSKLDEVLEPTWEIPSRSWQAALTEMINHFHRALIAAGAWIRFFDVTTQLDPNSMRRTQDVLARMIDQGLSLDEAGRAVDLTMSLLRDDAVIRASVVFRGSILEHARHIAETEGLDLMLDSINRSAALTEDERFRYSLERAIEGVESAHQRSRAEASVRAPARTQNDHV